jgi:hypothetical protein
MSPGVEFRRPGTAKGKKFKVILVIQGSNIGRKFIVLR